MMKRLLKLLSSRLKVIIPDASVPENNIHGHLLQSKVFCMAPWIQLHAQTNGTVMPCCMSSVYDNNELANLRENPSLEAAWNSEKMKQLRLNMLQGKENTLCDHCYRYEKMGRRSERMQYNEEYFSKFSERLTATLPDGTLDKFNVLLLDIRFSNKCNYKCRICDSSYSSLWYEDEQKIGKLPQLEAFKTMYVAKDISAFRESFEHSMNHVRRMHFAGGEPLVMEEHYEALRYLISIGRRDVAISYNTNFSTLRYKQYNITELWNQFDLVEVWASLDGMGKKGDYQRKGQRWDKIAENFLTVKANCPTVLFGVNITVSMFNILDITAFYKYLVENEFVRPERVNLYLLFDPSYFNITNLTPGIKQKVLDDFKDFEDNYLPDNETTANIRNHIETVRNFMLSASGDQLPTFRHWIETVDQLRGEKFREVFPELEELISVSPVA